MTKLEQLKCWMRSVRTFTTGDCISWGQRHGYTRADRAKRELMKAGFIRKLSEEEKRAKGYKLPTAVYEVTNFGPRIIEEPVLCREHAAERELQELGLL